MLECSNSALNNLIDSYLCKESDLAEFLLFSEHQTRRENMS